MFYPIEEQSSKFQQQNTMDSFKTNWDLFVTLVLLFTAFVTPYRVAYINNETKGWDITNLTIDTIFGLDILIIFNTAYYDEDFKIVSEYKSIAKKYISSWFFIDLLAILPFDLIFKASTTDFNELVRITRIGRMYKLVKLTRLMRIIKVIKARSKFFRYAHEYLSISVGFERIFLFVCGFLLICHVVGSLWALTVQFEDDIENTWIGPF